MLVIVPADHPLAGRRSIRLEELDGCEMVLRPTVSTTRQAFDRALRKAGVTVRPVMEINSREANREAYLVCLAPRRNRPLIDTFFRTAASIEPGRRGSL